MSQYKLLKSSLALLLLSSVIVPSIAMAEPTNGNHFKNGSDNSNGNSSNSIDTVSILFNRTNNYKYKMNGYIALNSTYNVGGSEQGEYQAQGQGQYQGGYQAQGQYQVQGQYQAQGQGQYQGGYQAQAQGQYQAQAQYQAQGQYQGGYQNQSGCQSNTAQSYNFQSQYQGQSQASCGQFYENGGHAKNGAEHANKNGGEHANKNGGEHANKNGGYQAQAQYQTQVNKNGGNHGWNREIFYCLGTDFLSLTFGSYGHGGVSFNDNQVLECAEGQGVFLNSDGQLSCGAHQPQITYSTHQSILYIHASKILAVKGECTSPKGGISVAPTLYLSRSIYVKGSQYQAQYQAQGQYQSQYQAQGQYQNQGQYQSQYQAQGQHQQNGHYNAGQAPMQQRPYLPNENQPRNIVLN